jgi:hypothetical protein
MGMSILESKEGGTGDLELGLGSIEKGLEIVDGVGHLGVQMTISTVFALRA